MLMEGKTKPKKHLLFHYLKRITMLMDTEIPLNNFDNNDRHFLLIIIKAFICFINAFCCSQYYLGFLVKKFSKIFINFT